MNARARACLSAILVTACSGTDTGNPPLAFDSSPCKSAALSQALMTKGIEPSAPIRDPEHDGFICTLWERLDDDTLRIEFTNLTSGCGADQGWEPRIKEGGAGKLDIYLDHTDCVFASCGYCVYDVSFEVRVPTQTTELAVQLFGDGCDGPAPLRRSATLPLTAQRSGALCTGYRPPTFAEAGISCRPTSSSRWGYCSPDMQVAPCSSLRAPCEDGLECTSVGDAGAICLPTCTSDADCKDAGPTHCEDGVCKL
jgi:hypothetical protein